MKKEYQKDDVTIVWQPKLCTHSAVCAYGLPDVFKPRERPWIKIDAASAERIVKQVKKCPSGALSFYKNEKKTTVMENESGNVTQIKILDGGPIMVTGKICITDKNGEVVEKEKAALCRCGLSSNKPFCDGAHRTSDFDK